MKRPIFSFILILGCGLIAMVVFGVVVLLYAKPSTTKTLHQAVISGDLRQVKSHLYWGCDINRLDWAGYTPLHRAAQKNLYVMVKALLAGGADVNCVNDFGISPLHLAIRDNASVKVVKALLAAGARINQPDGNGQFPLHLAAAASRKDLVDVLLAHGADLEVQDVYGQTALLVAASSGSRACVKTLLDHGAKVMARDHFGWTALHWAAGGNNILVADDLIGYGTAAATITTTGITSSFMLKGGVIRTAEEFTQQVPLWGDFSDLTLAFDGSTKEDSYWQVLVTYPLWMSFTWRGVVRPVTGYTFHIGKDCYGMPSSWTLKGSMDGRSWSLVDQQDKQSSWKSFAGKRFTLAVPRLYRYYRFVFYRGLTPGRLRIYDVTIHSD